MPEKTELDDLKRRVTRIEAALHAMVELLGIFDADKAWTKKEQREKAEGGEPPARQV